MHISTLRLLGACELLAPDGKPVPLSTRKSLAMLAYLSRQPDRGAKRQRLAALLWEEADQEQARLHVRKALWLVRSESAKVGMDPPPVVGDAGMLFLADSVGTDADAFLAAASEAGEDAEALEAACQLYTGDFLTDFEVRNAPAFDDWAAGERQRIREAALAAMRRLVDLQLARPDATEAALRATLRLLAFDPLQEHAHRALMRLHVRQGRPAAALSQFHQLRETLRRELGVEPEPATQELFLEIGRARRTSERRAGVQHKLSGTPPTETPLAGAETLPTVSDTGGSLRSKGWRGAGIAALMALAGLLWWIWPTASPPRVARVFPVSTGLVMSGRPALSADGGRLVFTARPDGSSNVDLYVMTLGDRQPVRLTSDPAIDDNAAWSPDATSIAFVRLAPGGDRPCRIYVMSVPAGAERAVGRCETSANTSVAWSRDGAEIYFSDQPQPDAPYRIQALTISSGAVRPITDPPADAFGDRNPVVSRDGEAIAFLRDAAGRSTDLFVIERGGGEPRRLTSEGGVINGLAWSDGDDGLFYSSDRAGDAGLWWIAAGGGDPHRISAGLLDYRRISHAADRPLLIFEAVRDRSELRLVKSDGSLGGFDPIPGLSSDARDTFPDLARDGALVFVSTRSGQEQLWVDGPGRQPRQLTQLEGWRLSDPRWSPDGRHIAFVGARGGTTDIYLIAREGGAPIRLTSDSAEDAAPGWSPDGKTLYFGSRRGGASRIWRMAPFARDRSAAPVSEPGPGDLRVDPRGRWIAYLYPGRAGIWRRALAPDGTTLVGPEERLVSDFAPMDWMNWAMTADALFYASRSAGLGSGRIRRLDLASGRAGDVAEAGPVHRQSSFAAGPSGELIVPVRTVEVDLFQMQLAQ